jgi:type II secretory ATPase GspE/PulE/Tfp pilus assembly ATPase PilB-like protein/GAF domain-containing protein
MVNFIVKAKSLIPGTGELKLVEQDAGPGGSSAIRSEEVAERPEPPPRRSPLQPSPVAGSSPGAAPPPGERPNPGFTAKAGEGLSPDRARRIQEIGERIVGAASPEDAIADAGQEICDLFLADRITVYVVTEDRTSIVARIKTGLSSFRDLKLPITETSIAGYCAYHRLPMNFGDVYDDAELKLINPRLTFLREVDRRTGYRTRQMLVLPIVQQAEDGAQQLVGVIQLINSRTGDPFDGPAVEGLSELSRHLSQALRPRAGGPITGRYDHLVTDGALTSGELELATRTARRKSRDLEGVLIEEFQLRPSQIGQALARYYSLDYEPFRSDRVRPGEALKNLKREFLESSGWVPVDELPDGSVAVAAWDPEKVRSTHSARNVYPRRTIVFRVTTQHEFNLILDQFFTDGAAEGGTAIGEMIQNLSEDPNDEQASTPDDVNAASENEVVKLVNKIIIDAHRMGASDIHIEPYPGRQRTLVRFRRDGTLQNYIEIPASYRNPVITRLKIMCDLDISEKRKPQDGKIKFRKYGPLDIELRVATVPSAGGLEDVVMRILASGDPLPLSKMALSKHNLEQLKSIITKPYGMFLTCGPTGSGKTTTLHACLAHINTAETKIWTAEDPVEITQRGLRQVQMNPKAGLTFATAMRAFLRADPDVIMVGEMRDEETASTGVEASLTGHLVFSTLHTNSAPESVVRLLDMGMDPFNFADAVLGILAQRLAKRLCGDCKTAYTPDAGEIDRLLAEYSREMLATPAWQVDPEGEKARVLQQWQTEFGNAEGQFTLYRPTGCDACGGTGYRGRVGLHELLVGSDRVKKAIQERSTVAVLLAICLEEGMRTLKQDGIEKVVQGLTDLVQVRAVCIK